MIRETLQENNKELCKEIKESVIKELDYQFRTQKEREEERDRLNAQRNEEYYKKMDELLRKKTRMKSKRKTDIIDTEESNNIETKKEIKKKRHSIF